VDRQGPQDDPINRAERRGCDADSSTERRNRRDCQGFSFREHAAGHPDVVPPYRKDGEGSANHLI
jgi:hypothetical protein